jgi:hypothetical protein
MKKTFVVVLLLATYIAAFTQDGNLKKQTYFRFGFSFPTWKYFGYDGRDEWNDDTKRTGGVFEVGNIFMLNSIKLAPGMRLGINADYLSVDFHSFSLDSELDSYRENLLFIGSKIGPSFSYSPVKRLVFDAFVKFNPVWVAGDFYSLPSTEENDFYLGFLGIKYSVGMNVRYSILMMGFEFNPGFVKLRWFDKDARELTEEYIGNMNDNSNKTPVPGMNFTIGLSF